MPPSGSVSRAFARALALALLAGTCPAIGAATGPAFGSGHFGQWVADSWGLPAYDYTIDERTAPQAILPELNGPGIDRTSAWSQLGNDHIVATAYNHGYVQLWSQDLQAQWMNAYDEASRQFAGGFGYLCVDGRVVGTLAADRTPGQGFERRFGAGYFRHALSQDGISVEEFIYAPYGDSPVLDHDVTLENRTGTDRSVVWWEYWGVNPVALTFPIKTPTIPVIKRFHPVFMTRGLGAARYDRRMKLLSVAQEPFEDDVSPLSIFAAAVDAPVDGFETTTDGFFGTGGRRDPAAPRRGRSSDTLAPASRNAGASKTLFAFRSPVVLKAGQRMTLRYVYGCAHPDRITALVREEASHPDALMRSQSAWKAWLPEADFGPDYAWLARELRWAAYSVRSASVYEEKPGRHVITQGGAYQYGMGLQIAFRDPLQHMLPIIYADPGLAREVLLYSAQEQDSFDGTIPYGMMPMGHQMDFGVVCDLDSWLLLASAEYAFATRDFGFFDTPVRWSDGGTASLWEHLRMAYRHQESFATGMHGLYATGRTGDWSDAIPDNVGLTETTMVPAQLAYVYPLFAKLARVRGDAGLASRVENRAGELRGILAREWIDRGWYSRGYAARDRVGSGVLFEEPQPWAILAGAPTSEQSSQLVGNLRRFLTGIGAPAFLHGPSRIGSSMSPAANDPLVTEHDGKPVIGDDNAVFCGGTWFALNGSLTWALASLDGKLPHAREFAWDELLRNTLAYHAEAFPEHWDGTISVGDVCWSWYSSQPQRCGGNGGRYFGQNTHQPAWLWYDLIKLVGIEPTPEGCRIDPHLPLRNFVLRLPEIGLRMAQNAESGYFRPVTPTAFQVRLRAPALPGAESFATFVDGKPVPNKLESGFVVFEIPGSARRPVRRWEIAPSGAAEPERLNPVPSN